ncbi:hypothetical protein BS47DRAFT_1396054 [Hydnum rufescens UP504]|uniref:Uncharacterized protein n=1 Tax=Hydnum rufescens UP504 TaxID=1448309 RepID=A0A9P6AR09_9AGAM|nr:hypothetical protein BS47DRAFT_1396054 [Hydnum rufescens UP504]
MSPNESKFEVAEGSKFEAIERIQSRTRWRTDLELAGGSNLEPAGGPNLELAGGSNLEPAGGPNLKVGWPSPSSANRLFIDVIVIFDVLQHPLRYLSPDQHLRDSTFHPSEYAPTSLALAIGDVEGYT